MSKLVHVIGGICFWFGCMLLFGMNANAYIDPSVVTYLIQAVAGIVIASCAVVGIYGRRVQKRMNEKLGVDANKNKEVESDDIWIKVDETK